MKNGDKKRQYRISRRARACRQNPNFPAYCSQKDQRSKWGLVEDQSTKAQWNRFLVESLGCRNEK